MKVLHFDYTLECKHLANANVLEESSADAYHKGMEVKCPQCHYQLRKIVSEKQSKAEI